MAEQRRGRNRLANETSPYLLQHADNPVDWYPWGDEAFAAARASDRPVLLSVGYSTCHWCHVMAHESFEDPAIAALMNEGFVSIKVDREERPDVDNVYMTVTQAMTGQGGWPMTVFLTPDGRPFYAGTYFPPDDGYGRPGFRRLLEAIRHAWEHDRPRLLESAETITSRLQEATARSARAGATDGVVTSLLTEEAAGRFRASYDVEWGGFGTAPKFPSPANLEFLLMHGRRLGPEERGAPTAHEMVLHTLRRMVSGGMYDHLGGGFARYSVDRYWLVPHFEKMLYDNAQLARVYLHAYQITHDPTFERIAHETLEYLAREMLAPEGGFYSAQDADSEGIEGKFFVWTVAEVEEVLGEDAALFNAAFGVTPQGNFFDPHHPELEHRNVLSRVRPLAAVAAEFGLTEQDAGARLERARTRILEARAHRVPPGRDDKGLTSWNGLALAAFAEAGRILGNSTYTAIAVRNAEFVRAAMWRDGRLLHSYKDGVARIDGMLEDYALYGLGLIELYRATGDLAHLQWAGELLEAVRARFHDDEGGAFFETAADAEQLILRQKPFFDAATPSGNGAVALLAAWLSRYFERPAWEELATEVIASVREQIPQAASGFGTLLQTIELLLAPRRELAIVGPPERRAPFEAEVAQRYLPTTVLAPTSGGGGLPVLEGREAPGVAAYVCEDMVCALPATTVEALAQQLDAASAVAG